MNPVFEDVSVKTHQFLRQKFTPQKKKLKFWFFSTFSTENEDVTVT